MLILKQRQCLLVIIIHPCPADIFCLSSRHICSLITSMTLSRLNFHLRQALAVDRNNACRYLIQKYVLSALKHDGESLMICRLEFL